jgi:hypothetical protein
LYFTGLQSYRLRTTVATTNSPTKEDVAKLTCLRKPQTKINEELNTAKSELCEAASQRKVFEIIALFDEKDIESTAEMAEKAVSWNMANWKHKDIEVITISAGYSYEQLLYVARNQTCNHNCDPPWYYVVAPLIVLPGFSAKVQ